MKKYFDISGPTYLNAPEAIRGTLIDIAIACIALPFLYLEAAAYSYYEWKSRRSNKRVGEPLKGAKRYIGEGSNFSFLGHDSVLEIDNRKYLIESWTHRSPSCIWDIPMVRIYGEIVGEGEVYAYKSLDGIFSMRKFYDYRHLTENEKKIVQNKILEARKNESRFT